MFNKLILLSINTKLMILLTLTNHIWDRKCEQKFKFTVE